MRTTTITVAALFMTAALAAAAPSALAKPPRVICEESGGTWWPEGTDYVGICVYWLSAGPTGGGGDLVATIGAGDIDGEGDSSTAGVTFHAHAVGDDLAVRPHAGAEAGTGGAANVGCGASATAEGIAVGEGCGSGLPRTPLGFTLRVGASDLLP